MTTNYDDYPPYDLSEQQGMGGEFDDYRNGLDSTND